MFEWIFKSGHKHTVSTKIIHKTRITHDKYWCKYLKYCEGCGVAVEDWPFKLQSEQDIANNSKRKDSGPPA